MRNASLTLEACSIVNSRRGGVLIHVASRATLTDCTVAGSCLSGLDVRTGAEAVVEACTIRGGRASGIYVSTGGSVRVFSTLIEGNRLAAVEVKADRQPPPPPPPSESNKKKKGYDDVDNINNESDALYSQGEEEGHPTLTGGSKFSSSNGRPRKSAVTWNTSSSTAVAGREGEEAVQLDYCRRHDRRDGAGTTAAGRGVVEGGGKTTPDCRRKRCGCRVSLGSGNVVAGNGLNGVMGGGDGC
ncbi:unnamed protein product [Ectocarpus sp. 4 AP-2014]